MSDFPSILNCRKSFNVVDAAGYYQFVFWENNGIRYSMDEVLALTLHPDDGDFVFFPAFAADERESDDRFGSFQPCDGEFVPETDEIQQPFVKQVRNTLSHALFGKDDMLRARPFENASVFVVGRLGPYVRKAEVGQGEHGPRRRSDNASSDGALGGR